MLTNQWLDDFRDSLSNLGKSIYDYQNNIPGSLLDVVKELQSIAKQVVREFGSKLWTDELKSQIISKCVMHLTQLEKVNNESVPQTSVLDSIDLSSTDPFNFCVLQMVSILNKGK